MTDALGSAAWRQAHAHSLLDFALRARSPLGGFGWLDDDGNIDPTQGRELLVTARMTHVHALGTLLGHPGCREATRHGLDALAGVFRDEQYGGWYPCLNTDGAATNDTKGSYDHSFVILASSSALVAGDENAWPLLEEALDISGERFWDDAAGMVVERWDRAFTRLDPYRGVNANMHTVEAYLAAADALEFVDSIGGARGPSAKAGGLAGRAGEVAGVLRARVGRIIDRVINREARANNWRIPEHFDSTWRPQLEFNRDHPADQFRPYGATIGHGMEWTRLCLQAAASIPQPAGSFAGPSADSWLVEAAEHLYVRAVADGWAADGADGFVYTTDWEGAPVVHERMWWVVAEAIGAADALLKAGCSEIPLPDGGRAQTSSSEGGRGAQPLIVEADLARWWAYADRYLIDHERGSWHHELDRHNVPSALVWPGKSDIYHALQATLLPSLPLAPAITVALARQ